MRIRQTIAASAIGLAAMCLSAAAAPITFEAVPYTSASTVTGGQTLVTDFDTGTSPATLDIAHGYSFSWCSNGCSTTYRGLNTNQTGLYDNVALINGIAARPLGSVNSGTGNPGQYFAVLGSDGGQATLTSSNDLTGLSLLWGSVDSYNYISFYDGQNLVESFSGSDFANPANGDQGSPATNLEVLFNIPLADDVNEVVFSSSGNSFEFDNIEATTVPEPATWAMLLLGFLGIGFMVRISRRKDVAAVA